MRSVEFPWHKPILTLLCVAAAGCASLDAPLKSLKESFSSADPATSAAPVTDTAQSAPAAASPASAAGSAVAHTEAAPEPEKPADLPPVSAAVQRAFDEALRAMRAGRLADAERGFKALIASNPELGGAHANLGLIHRHAGKAELAVAELEAAVAASPSQPIFFNQLGIAYREVGKFTKAREAYERAIALDASYASPHLNLGILHDLYLWDGKRALELYGRYLALSPGGDTTVVKWVADLKNRKPQHAMLARKEKE